jgi:hypothetical protein
MIPYSRVEDALKFLAETDEQEAKLKALVEKTKEKMKSVFKIVAAASSGTVLEKEGKAYKHPDYESSADAHFTAIAQHQQLMNERKRQVLIIDVWRSLNAARNKGQIV